jgi:hypothetical protein
MSSTQSFFLCHRTSIKQYLDVGAFLVEHLIVRVHHVVQPRNVWRDGKVFHHHTHIGSLVVWAIRAANGWVIKTNVRSRSSYVTMGWGTKRIVSSPSRACVYATHSVIDVLLAWWKRQRCQWKNWRLRLFISKFPTPLLLSMKLVTCSWDRICCFILPRITNVIVLNLSL